jgi:serine/threonine protein kinase
VLGCGGMGAVYLAYDQRIQGRQVAVKENLDTTPLARNQFDAEVKVMAALRHPNLPGISDHFTGPNGRQYLVMDYIAGETLEDMVTQRGPLPEAEVVALTRQLLDALDYLHSNRVVHRDIKPSNIKRAPDGRLYLVDFGISKRQATGVVTQSWARGVGSPGFAPLEQYHGGTDGRSDIYSLGAVIYFLLPPRSRPTRLIWPAVRCSSRPAGSSLAFPVTQTGWCCGPWPPNRCTAFRPPPRCGRRWVSDQRPAPFARLGDRATGAC